MSSRLTQEEEVLGFLQENANRWVPSYALSNIALQYNARIFTLRRKGHDIENRTRQLNGQTHGEFRYNAPRGQRGLFSEKELSAASERPRVQMAYPD